MKTSKQGEKREKEYSQDSMGFPYKNFEIRQNFNNLTWDCHWWDKEKGELRKTYVPDLTKKSICLSCFRDFGVEQELNEKFVLEDDKTGETYTHYRCPWCWTADIFNKLR